VRRLRILRKVVGVGAILFAAAVFIVWLRRPRPVGDVGGFEFPALRELLPVFASRPSLLSRGFVFVGTEGGRPLYRVAARELVGFEEGWIVLRGVQLALYDETGAMDLLVGEEGRVHRERRVGQISGEVRIFGADGSALSASEVEFDAKSRVARISGPVSGWMPGLTLEAGRARLDSRAGRLELEDGVRAFFETGAPGSGAAESERRGFHLSALRAVVERGSGRYEFDGPVRIAGKNAWIEAGRLTIQEASDGGSTRFAGTAGVAGLLAENALEIDSVGAPPPAALHFVCFGGGSLDGTIDGADRNLRSLLIEAGEGNASVLLHDRAQGEPVRTLATRRLAIDLSAGRVRRAEATGSFEIAERKEPGPGRRLAGERLVVGWSGKGDAPSRSEAWGNLLLEEGVRRAEGTHLVDLPDEGGRSILEGDRASWQDDRIHVTASKIEHFRRGDRVVASGNDVHGRYLPEVDRSATPWSSEGEPFFWSCRRLEADGDAREARLVGSARIWQGEKLLRAEEIRISEAMRSILADRNVRLVVPPRKKVAGAKGDRSESESSTVATGSTLDYRELEGTARLGGGATLASVDRRLSASELVFCVDRSGSIERVFGEGSVELSDPSAGRKGRADRMDYRIADQHLVLEAAPGGEAWIEERGGNRITGSVMTIDGEAERARVVSTEGRKSRSKIEGKETGSGRERKPGK
jgi:lipopolysaccharide export system protein LptA